MEDRLPFPPMISTEQPNTATLSLAETAQALGCAPKTVRQRIKRGELPAHLLNGTHGPEYRVPISALSEITLPSPETGYPLSERYPPLGNGTVPSGSSRVLSGQGTLEQGTVEEDTLPPPSPLPEPAPPQGEGAEKALVQAPVLQARLEGAHLAAKLHAERRADAEERLREERERWERMVEEERRRHDRDRGELATELEFLRGQLQQSRDAERELRLLMARTTLALEQVAEKPALEAHLLPPTRRRWYYLWLR